jgi:hypothetical protein
MAVQSTTATCRQLGRGLGFKNGAGQFACNASMETHGSSTRRGWLASTIVPISCQPHAPRPSWTCRGVCVATGGTCNMQTAYGAQAWNKAGAERSRATRTEAHGIHA